jgi:hypothetical protein
VHVCSLLAAASEEQAPQPTSPPLKLLTGAPSAPNVSAPHCDVKPFVTEDNPVGFFFPQSKEQALATFRALDMVNEGFSAAAASLLDNGAFVPNLELIRVSWNEPLVTQDSGGVD